MLAVGCHRLVTDSVEKQLLVGMRFEGFPLPNKPPPCHARREALWVRLAYVLFDCGVPVEALRLVLFYLRQ